MMTRVRDITHKDRRQRTGGLSRVGTTLTVGRRYVYTPDDHVLTFTCIYLMGGDEYVTKVAHSGRVDGVYFKGDLASSRNLHSRYSKLLTQVFDLDYSYRVLQHLYSIGSKDEDIDGQLLVYEAHKKGVYISYIYRVFDSEVVLQVTVGDIVFSIDKTGNGRDLTRIADKLVKLQLNKY